MALFLPSHSSALLPLQSSHRTLRKTPTHVCVSSSTVTLPLTKLKSPPALEPSHDRTTETHDKSSSSASPSPPDRRNSDFYVNLGVAVRTLREDIPSVFSKDLNYNIYREDITFIDPLNTFKGIENYRLIFWSLRFHGRILFRDIGAAIFRVWQPSENSIWIRWELQGVPRVPWEAKGRFRELRGTNLIRMGRFMSTRWTIWLLISHGVL
ncbi:hypothetical protein HPP92_011008 [Vanilla planifolia]|uniref:Uncharacterized protein n=1 Tax=Vanilla planifolia TaxID=51239 RepID=A0A835R209_VANPL|nr:hypothetical protein HPP92_011008 [Vanilla planifolia]